ncbi:uncharacterized protein DUF5016 [Dysgonomonas alginatilytica]|uniref:Uncharacterized protein DUF5016 n=1 Tax=Dysgonomonas alginatilytica TaxID=1605892 RepID=A0A2V3PJZ9_9BACT|nr:DUF5016 domain-containing protein [Dysgonomonas alginatilytica]PXV58909.1 uncharacterized protein DUF5016 [Dysgonomonas alginatilytica]
MKIRNINILLGLLAVFMLVSCEEKDERTVYPHSTPVIESATINPASFVYGDSVTFTAKVSDPITPLSTLEMRMVVNDRVIATQTLRTKGNSTEVSAKFKTAYISELTDNADVEISVNVINVEGDVTASSIKSIKGYRTYYKNLYLVLDNGEVITLTSKGDKSDKYESPEVNMKNSIRYKIAEKITADKQIDFSGHVWGLKDGTIQIVDEDGGYIATSEPMKKSTIGILFDTYTFVTSLLGEDLVNISSLSPDVFMDTTIGGETFKEGSFYIEKNKEITLTGDLKDALFNVEYFERISADKVKFLGETGPWVLDYSATRKYVLVQDLDSNYPNVLVASGEGLGYPSKVKPEATSGWGFDLVKQFILFKKVADNTYQATVYFDATKANFKFYENKGWANEKLSDDYTLPAIVINSTAHFATHGGNIDGNWYAAPNAESGNYKITINLATKVVTAVAVTLP